MRSGWLTGWLILVGIWNGGRRGLDCVESDTCCRVALCEVLRSIGRGGMCGAQFLVLWLCSFLLSVLHLMLCKLQTVLLQMTGNILPRQSLNCHYLTNRTTDVNCSRAQLGEGCAPQESLWALLSEVRASRQLPRIFHGAP